MSAIIRAFGESFDVDAFLDRTTLPSPLRVTRKGDSIGTPKNPRTSPYAALTFESSGAKFEDFNKQEEESLAFLNAHATELTRLCHFPGVENCWLDFGVNPKLQLAMQGFSFSKELTRIAGALGLGINLSVYYGMSNMNDDPPAKNASA